MYLGTLRTLSIKIAQKPYLTGSLGPKALKYESFEGKGELWVPYSGVLLSKILQSFISGPLIFWNPHKSFSVLG